MQRAIDYDFGPLASFIAGKSRSDVGRLRDEKMTEVRMLGARIAAQSGLCDGDRFPQKRDQRRIAELQKEIAYLTSLFDSPSPDGPSEAA